MPVASKFTYNGATPEIRDAARLAAKPDTAGVPSGAAGVTGFAATAVGVNRNELSAAALVPLPPPPHAGSVVPSTMPPAEYADHRRKFLRVMFMVKTL